MQKHQGEVVTQGEFIQLTSSDCSDTLASVLAYFENLLLGETSPFSVASRVNGEAPSKLEGSRLTLIALAEERLAARGQTLLVGLSAKARIRFYDSKLEHSLATTIEFPNYPPWDPRLAHRVQQAGLLSACACALAALAAVVIAVRANALHQPIHATIASLSALLFVAAVVISIIVAFHPEKLPTVMTKERLSAKAHLEEHLRRVGTVYMDVIRAAELSLSEQITLLSKESA